MEDSYRYQPLPPIVETQRTPPLTRILWLAPGSGEEPFSGRLEIINVEDAPRYEALSYTWGTDPPSNYIWIHGQPLPIRPNLEAALGWLRLPNQTRLVWIDALCIDQSDLDERSRQVQYMRLVYKHAARAIVWVGSKTPGVEAAFEMARRMQRIIDFGEEQKRNGQVDADAIMQFTTSLMRDLPPESMQYLHQLLSRPYFSRCWCVQEVVACSWAIVKCEELEIPFMDLASSIFAVIQSTNKLNPSTTLYLWWRIWDNRHSTPTIGRPRVEGSLGPMLSLLDMTRALEATDIRDKIFSLQGICDEGLQPSLALTQIMGTETTMLRGLRRGINRLTTGINSLGPGLDFGRPQALKANYRKEPRDVFIDLTRFMIRKSPRVLDVLAHVMHTSNPEGGEYPSWVPKWFEPKTCHMMTGYYLAGFCDGHFRYFAEVHDNPLRGVPRNPRVLSIDGFHVDVVHSVTDVVQFDPPDDATTVEVLERSWSQLFPFPMTLPPQQCYRDEQPLDLVFCKTISAYPFGDVICIAFGGSVTGIEMRLPDDFMDQAISTFTDGGTRAQTFLDERRENPGEADTSSYSKKSFEFLLGVRVLANNRRVFITQDGRLGLGPQVMQPGDQVVVLFGNRLPYIVRPRDGHHVFIGDCYIVDEEVMRGRITEKILRGSGGPPRVTFNLH